MSIPAEVMEFSFAPQPNPGFKCRRAPTAAEWDAIRPIFTELYRFQGMTLPRAMQFLKEKHNFDATTKMYKNKIMAWELCKYTKQRDVNRLLKLKERLGADKRPCAVLFRGSLVDLSTLEGKRARAERRGCWKTSEEGANANADALDVQLIELGSPYNMADEPEIFWLMQKLLSSSQVYVERYIAMEPSVLQCPDEAIATGQPAWLAALHIGLDYLVSDDFAEGGMRTRHGCALLYSTFTNMTAGKVYVDLEMLLDYVCRCRRTGYGRLGKLVLGYIREMLKSRSEMDSICVALDALLRLQEREEETPLKSLVENMLRQSLPKLLPPTHLEILWTEYLRLRQSPSFDPLPWTKSIQVSCGTRDVRYFEAVWWCSDDAFRAGDWATAATLCLQCCAAYNDDDSSLVGQSPDITYCVGSGYFKLAYAQAKLDDYDSSILSLRKACDKCIASEFPIEFLHDLLGRRQGFFRWFFAQCVDDMNVQHVQSSLAEYTKYLAELDQRELQETMRELGI